jgi:hypothetical protein
MLFVERNSGLPFLITLGGKSVTPLKKFLNAIMRMASFALSKGEKLGIYDFTADMYVKSITDSRGKYCVALFKNILRLRTPGEFRSMREDLVTRRNVVTDAPVVEDEVVPDAEVVDDGAAAFETANQVVDDDTSF